MATSAPSVQNLTLQKLIDALISSTRRPDGTVPDAAPNAFKDSLQVTVSSADTSDFELIVRTDPSGGNTASVQVRAIGSKALSIMGKLDTTILATKLV
jgi:hypothetical protein